MKKYNKSKKISQTEIFSPGWKVNLRRGPDIEDGDDLELVMIIGQNGGDARVFVADLILILSAAAYYGIIPAGGTAIKYSTVYAGMGAAGIIWFGGENDEIVITEIEENDGTTRRWKFLLEDLDTVINGKFEKVVGQRERVI